MEHPEESRQRMESGTQHRTYEERAQELVQQVRKLLAEGDSISALALFDQLHPVDQGELLVELDEEPRQEVLATLTPDAAADILEHLEPEQAAEVSEDVATPVLSQILDETSPDVAADILRELPPEKSQETLEAMEEAEEVAPLLQYADDSAGGVMTPEYPVVRADITTAIALDQIRLLGEAAGNVGSVFVVDDEQKLVGSLGVVRLALARPNAIVRDIMDPEVITVPPETDQEESSRLMGRYGLGQLPVVDAEGRLIGVILAKDAADVVEEEATEDMFKMAGLAGERVLGPLRNSVRSRLPWLLANLATVFLAASVVSLFESTIAKVVVLAAFLPVVAGQGGIAGTQTVTLVVRGMALGEIPRRAGYRVLTRELSLAVLHGVFLGLIVGVLGYVWKGNLMLGVILGAAMLGNMVVAGLSGAGIPLLLRAMRMDPAVSSAVFVTTMTDVIGFLLFLGLAALFITFLL